MKKELHIISFLMLDKIKFAISANILLLLIIFYNLALYAGKDADWIFSLFVAALVYFLAAAVYSLYIDVIKK